MGLAERNYDESRPPNGGGVMPSLTPVVKWLLIANIAIFVIDYLILPGVLGIQIDDYRRPPMVTWGAFTIDSAIKDFRIWEFITFQFLHDSLGHIIFNSLGLFFFGPWVERWWGSTKFIIFYLLCGCGGALFFTLLAYTGIIPDRLETALIGASAGIYGIFIAVAVISPNLRVQLLFPPIELSMRTLAIALLTISTVIILVGIGNNEGGEAGHLGGAIAGFLLVRYPGLLQNLGTRSASIPIRKRKPSPPKLRPRTTINTHSDSEVDRILDKISREGFQSLTQAERETLQEASNRQKKP